MKLNIFERLVLLVLATMLPSGTSALHELTKNLFLFVKQGEIIGDQENIFSRIND